MTAAELIHELVSECSPEEQLRLKAWANAARLDVDEPTAIQIKKRNNNGPDYSDDKAVMTCAIGASGQQVDFNHRPWKPTLFRRAIVAFLDWRSSQLSAGPDLSSVRASKIDRTAGSENATTGVKTHPDRGQQGKAK